MNSTKSGKQTRREFLQASAAAIVASHMPPSAQSAAAPLRESNIDANFVAVPDTGWRLWPDQQAEWKNDTIFLPEDVRLASLPVNPPTGGWKSLSATQGIPVTLPTTVEQYFWGLQGMRPYKDEYRFETADDEVKNGAYYGVSWWWHNLEIPAAFQGKRVFLHIRAARQRAEVYLNQQLVGYSIMEELPFECDITAAAHPGAANQLAIRITNPVAGSTGSTVAASLGATPPFKRVTASAASIAVSRSLPTDPRASATPGCSTRPMRTASPPTPSLKTPAPLPPTATCASPSSIRSRAASLPTLKLPRRSIRTAPLHSRPISPIPQHASGISNRPISTG
jgi:hypothetical protein